MNRLKEIKRLKGLAEKYRLEGREIIGKYNMQELCSIYNGIGPDAFPQRLRKGISALNPSLAVDGVVMTMYDGRTKLAQDVVGEVKKSFGDIVYHTLIPRNVRLSEAPSYGQPIIFYDKHSTGARVYKELAREVLKREQ